RRSLLIRFAPSALLAIFCPLPVRLGFIYGVPASVVVLFPTVTCVLVNIAIVSSVHVAAGSFADGAISALWSGSGRLSALRSRCACHCSIGGRVMARGSALVSSRHIRAAPLCVRTRTLPGLSIGPGVGVIGLGGASAAVWGRD